ncbi:hypothetical protein [Paenibacillus azoreducens]|uniref:Uncharacterized protein n=1 Tax=Paenibacillus azoreducens TaxID=116718 RepID=A0A920CUN6_9BACL|nr:hypothetical protein [Paenibacillus azoreducens]GIO49632.1 hypothetical protein J34TS1_43970 [Paenibacillus azoreducens]
MRGIESGQVNGFVIDHGEGVEADMHSDELSDKEYIKIQKKMVRAEKWLSRLEKTIAWLDRVRLWAEERASKSKQNLN